MFSNYTFSNLNFFIIFFIKFFFRIFFRTFFKFFFEKRKLCLKLFFKKIYVFLSIYLYIYQNPKFHIQKSLPHSLTLNPKSRLVNSKDIIVFYPSLKVSVKVISVNMKSGTMNVLFVAISLDNFMTVCLKINQS